MTDASRRYNHAVTIAFSVISNDPNGEDFTPAMLKAALQKRIEDMPDSEWLEAVGAPYDTFEEDMPTS